MHGAAAARHAILLSALVVVGVTPLLFLAAQAWPVAPVVSLPRLAMLDEFSYPAVEPAPALTQEPASLAADEPAVEVEGAAGESLTEPIRGEPPIAAPRVL